MLLINVLINNEKLVLRFELIRQRLNLKFLYEL